MSLIDSIYLSIYNDDKFFKIKFKNDFKFYYYNYFKFKLLFFSKKCDRISQFHKIKLNSDNMKIFRVSIIKNTVNVDDLGCLI